MEDGVTRGDCVGGGLGHPGSVWVEGWVTGLCVGGGLGHRGLCGWRSGSPGAVWVEGWVTRGLCGTWVEGWVTGGCVGGWLGQPRSAYSAAIAPEWPVMSARLTNGGRMTDSHVGSAAAAARQSDERGRPCQSLPEPHQRSQACRAASEAVRC